MNWRSLIWDAIYIVGGSLALGIALSFPFAEDCNYGDGQIRPGDDVEYHDDELMHRECATSTRKGDPPLCRQCFTHHRGECL